MITAILVTSMSNLIKFGCLTCPCITGEISSIIYEVFIYWYFFFYMCVIHRV